MSEARKQALVRVENLDALVAAMAQGKGVLVLTGHFGKWEVATTAAIAQFPHMRGKFHFARRALKPQRLDRLVQHRFNQARFDVFPKRGSLDAMLARIEQREVIAFPLFECENTNESIRRNALIHSRALERLVLRHPEQWYRMQRRWRHATSRRPPRGRCGACNGGRSLPDYPPQSPRQSSQGPRRPQLLDSREHG